MGAIWEGAGIAVGLGFAPVASAIAVGYAIYWLANPTTVYSN